MKCSNIFVLMIFMIGISNPVGALITTKPSWNPFESLSPLPLLFSFGKNRKSKQKGNTFVLVSEKNETQKFKFDRNFYKNLNGPHRYKVLFTLRLNWINYEKEPMAADFIQRTFCENYKPIENLAGQKLKSVQVLNREDKVVLDWKCKS